MSFLILSNLSLKNKAFSEPERIPCLDLMDKYWLIASIQALFKYIVLSLFPLPITFILHSENSISFIFIPTNSDKRIPQFKNSVIIAKSRSLFLSLSSCIVALNNFLLSSRDKYRGILFPILGVSKFKAGLASINPFFWQR